MIGIYKIISPSKRVYIGSSKNINKRWIKYRLLQCKSQIKLYNSFLKYGVENHIFEVVHECDVEDLYILERFYGEKFNCINDGLNCRLPRCGDKPAIIDDETREKLSKSHSGKKHTNETKEKLSKYKKGKSINKGVKKSDEHKTKIGESNKGKVRSDEYKNNHSLKMKEIWRNKKSKE